MKSNRIEQCFECCRCEQRSALIVYATVGYPSLAESETIIGNLIDSGADMIELGVPFSDPMADGPVIQEAGQKALANGATLKGVLDVAARIRANYPQTPLVLFSYYNVLLNYGLKALGEKLETAGVDAVLVVDLPLEERQELAPLLEHVTLIPLLSPATSPERARQIVNGAGGFAYYITVRGVTGVRSALPVELAGEIAAMRTRLPLPVAAGFGISTPEMARAVGECADAVVVGSAVMSLLLQKKNTDAENLVRGMRRALAK